MTECNHPDGCQLPAMTRGGKRQRIKAGLCETHYARRKRTGDVGPPGSLQHVPCAHPDGCDKKSASGSEYCAMHYSRLIRHGTLGPAHKLPTRRIDEAWIPADWSTESGPCLYPGGCDVPEPSGFHGGYCTAHYQRLRNRGDLGLSGNERHPKWGSCGYPGGCEIDTDIFVHGYCQHHAARISNSGSLGPAGLVEQWDYLQDQPTDLYRLWNENNDLLYVGISAGLDSRYAAHSRTKAWWNQVALAIAVPYPDRTAALQAETEAIQEERPRHNVYNAA